MPGTVEKSEQWLAWPPRSHKDAGGLAFDYFLQELGEQQQKWVEKSWTIDDGRCP